MACDRQNPSAAGRVPEPGSVKRAIVVVDLGFGDAGKGVMTDFLVRREGAGLVVRFNGGAQAGHNVVTVEGRHHTFSQFGSGTFYGARTFLTEHVLLDPDALVREARALSQLGVGEPLRRLRVSAEARVVTPYHRALGRLRELARGPERHGSCGAGVGEAVRDSIHFPQHTVRAAELLRPARLVEKLDEVRARKEVEALDLCPAAGAEAAFASEVRIFQDESVSARWASSCSPLLDAGAIADAGLLEEWVRVEECTVFEGAQGVLLDEAIGFHPYTTWSRSTSANALEVLADLAPEAERLVVGVLRAHACRHGPGPLPTECTDSRLAVREHNRSGPWQGPMRYGWFDAVLARYAIECDGAIDCLAVTFLDALPASGWPCAVSYSIDDELDGSVFDRFRSVSGALTGLKPPPEPSLSNQAALGRFLARAEPNFDSSSPDPASVIRRIVRALDRPVRLASFGQTADHVVAPSKRPASGSIRATRGASELNQADGLRSMTP